MKQRLALAVVVLILTTYAVTLWRPTTKGDISYDSFQKLSVGMTQKQVEDILGGPLRMEVHPESRIKNGVWPWEEWWGSKGMIYVAFDNAGKAWDIKFEPYDGPQPPPPSFTECMQSWLSW